MKRRPGRRLSRLAVASTKRLQMQGLAVPHRLGERAPRGRGSSASPARLFPSASRMQDSMLRGWRTDQPGRRERGQAGGARVCRLLRRARRPPRKASIGRSDRRAGQASQVPACVRRAGPGGRRMRNSATGRRRAATASRRVTSRTTASRRTSRRSCASHARSRPKRTGPSPASIRSARTRQAGLGPRGR